MGKSIDNILELRARRELENIFNTASDPIRKILKNTRVNHETWASGNLLSAKIQNLCLRDTQDQNVPVEPAGFSDVLDLLRSIYVAKHLPVLHQQKVVDFVAKVDKVEV